MNSEPEDHDTGRKDTAAPSRRARKRKAELRPPARSLLATDHQLSAAQPLPHRTFLAHAPQSFLALPNGDKDAVGQALARYWCEASRVAAGQHEQAWDQRRSALRRELWDALPESVKSRLGFKDFEVSIHAFFRARADLDRAAAHRDRQDARNFPDRIRRECGAQLREFVEAEPELLSAHEERLGEGRARKLEAQRGYHFDAEDQRPEVAADLLGNAAELAEGSWPGRSEAEITCYSPSFPDDESRKVVKAPPDLLRDGCGDDPLLKSLADQREGEELSKAHLRYEIQAPEAVEGASAPAGDPAEEADRRARVRTYRSVLSEFRGQRGRAGAFRCFRGRCTVREAAKRMRVPRATISDLRKRIEARLQARLPKVG